MNQASYEPARADFPAWTDPYRRKALLTITLTPECLRVPSEDSGETFAWRIPDHIVSTRV